MADYEVNADSPKDSRFSFRGMLIRDWPYFVMLALALFGVAYTNFARAAMTGYWIALAPIFGAICVAVRWPAVEGGKSHVRLAGSQALHWAAVVFAMDLVFVADVKQMMSDFGSSLMVLTVLALGTFTAGIHIAAWRVCLVGIVLGLGVPAIAWFEERTLLMFLLALALVGAVGVFFVLEHRRGTKAAEL
jgi:hypothetical protein